MFWCPLPSNFIISSFYFVWLYFVVLNQVNWILCSLSFHLSYLLIFNFYEFPTKFHIGFTDITLCSHYNLLLNCVTSVMTVSLSYLKAMSLPPKYTHTNVGVFVSDLCFCLFCFLEGGKASCCWSFYGTVIRKHNLLFFVFWKSADFLCGTKQGHFEGLFHVLGKHIHSQEADWEMESHWIPTVIFSLQNYTLFLQRIWFILLSIDKFLNT